MWCSSFLDNTAHYYMCIDYVTTALITYYITNSHIGASDLLTKMIISYTMDQCTYSRWCYSWFEILKYYFIFSIISNYTSLPYDQEENLIVSCDSNGLLDMDQQFYDM